MRTYALQQRYGNDFAFSSRRSEGMHYVCSRLSERSTEDSRTDADDSASLWKYASSVFVSRVRIFWRRELSDGRHADGRNRPTSHGRSRVELMWRWTTTRGGIFWRVVSPRGSRHLPCLFPYLLPLVFYLPREPPRHPQLTATHTPCCKGKHRQMRGRRVRVLRRTELPHRTPPQGFLDPRTRLRSNLSF